MELVLFKELILGQYEAALSMLDMAIRKCPAPLWNGPVANNTFSESAFHVLFFGDLYLGIDVDAQKTQSFHQANAEHFRDYEELEPRKPTYTYERAFVEQYLVFCRDKARRVMAEETSESLAAPAGFSWLDTSRAEVHLYNIRHLQHHAAQLIMRLRLENSDAELPWVEPVGGKHTKLPGR